MQVTAYLLLVYLQMYCIGFNIVAYLCAVLLSNVTCSKWEMPITKTQMNTRRFFFFHERDSLFVLQIFELKYYEGTNRFIGLRGLSQNWVCNCYLIRAVDAIISLHPLNSEHEGSSCSAGLLLLDWLLNQPNAGHKV